MPGIHFELPRHPLGVKPSGNTYGEHHSSISSTPFDVLPGELILEILGLLDSKSLARVGAVCKSLYAYSRFDDLWRTLCIESPPTPLNWLGSWHATLTQTPRPSLKRISCSGVYSDALYRPFQCTHTPLSAYSSNILPANQIRRFSDLTPEEFQAKWTNTPFILTEPVTKWPILKAWSNDDLLAKYSETVFRAEAVDWPLRTYVSYMMDNADESPLYLFDRSFVEKMDLSVGQGLNDAYNVPQCFGDDLFSVLHDSRPDSRWLIVGPARSGSTFHKDPNATSAWNAVLTGSKYWIMFPPSTLPPGVFVSEDQSEVTSPLSIAEWLLEFHTEARQASGCIEGICKAGEVLHVPSGWWHLVVNLEPCIAITGNFISEAHLVNVLRFLKDKKDQVSGFKKGVDDPYTLFVEKMRIIYPDVLDVALERIKSGDSKKRKWRDLVADNTVNEHESAQETNGGFSFGFAVDGDEDEEDEIGL